VGVLVETARSPIFAPVPPATGVDVVFFDRGAALPGPAIVIENPCGAENADSGACDAERLSAAALRLLARLRSAD
jgi:hypothetical protein